MSGNIMITVSYSIQSGNIPSHANKKNTEPNYLYHAFNTKIKEFVRNTYVMPISRGDIGQQGQDNDTIYCKMDYSVNVQCGVVSNETFLINGNTNVTLASKLSVTKLEGQLQLVFLFSEFRSCDLPFHK